MNKRLKEVRKSLGLTQQEFADTIGSKRNTIAKYETETNVPSTAVISLICSKFNVNEEWLRTGKGEMFMKLSRSEEIASFMGDVLTDEDGSTFKKQLISVLSKLNENEWKVLESIAEKMADEKKD